MRILLAVALAAGAACATVPAESGSGACDADVLGDLVGREPSQSLGEEALRRSGARTLRWIRPGDAVTMDYSPSRLNIRLDARHRIEGFSCG